ncbi:MAG: serine/threonine-protein phosphatase [Actinobacteria bacterium]|nr:serine/threonine-protein phosphatase [Actinomycetota bacterium]
MTGAPTRVRESAHRSDVGRQRGVNEDRYLDDAPRFAVADGVGGARDGGRAAETAMAAVGALGPDAQRDELVAALRRANDTIRSDISAEPDREGMGTTATVAFVRARSLLLAHVGDSRAYVLRQRGLRQITDDHSLVAELTRTGAIKPDEAAVHPYRNVITRAIGAADALHVDTAEFPTEPGDVLMLCTDGLCGQVDDAAIADALAVESTLADAAQRLVALANTAGGADNVTVVLARLS